jgi:hypothetical protein
VHLQVRHLRFDIGDGRQHHRNHDQGSQLARHAIVEIEPWQRTRTQRTSDDSVDDRHSDVRGGSDGQDRNDDHGHVPIARQQEPQRHDERSHEQQQPRVEGSPGAHQRPFDAPGQADRGTEGTFEIRVAVRDQVVAGIATSRLR